MSFASNVRNIALSAAILCLSFSGAWASSLSAGKATMGYVPPAAPPAAAEHSNPLIATLQRTVFAGKSILKKPRAAILSKLKLYAPAAPQQKSVGLFSAIEDSARAAMKLKDTKRLAVLIEIQAALKAAAKANQLDTSNLYNEDCYPILRQLAKQRRLTIGAFKQAGHDMLVEASEFELSVIEGFLPSQDADKKTLE